MPIISTDTATGGYYAVIPSLDISATAPTKEKLAEKLRCALAGTYQYLNQHKDEELTDAGVAIKARLAKIVKDVSKE